MEEFTLNNNEYIVSLIDEAPTHLITLLTPVKDNSDLVKKYCTIMKKHNLIKTYLHYRFERDPENERFLYLRPREVYFTKNNLPESVRNFIESGVI